MTTTPTTTTANTTSATTRKKHKPGPEVTLSPAQIAIIRKRWAKQRASGVILSREFNVSMATISRVINRKPPYAK